MRQFLVLAGLLVILAGCGGTTAEQQVVATVDAAAACRGLAIAYGDEMKPIFAEWQDAVKLADQTGRGNLPPQISALQTIKRKADDIKPPQCADKAHGFLVSSMNSTIDGFLAFMAQKEESVVSLYFTNAADDIASYQEELVKATTVQATATPKP